MFTIGFERCSMSIWVLFFFSSVVSVRQFHHPVLNNGNLVVSEPHPRVHKMHSNSSLKSDKARDNDTNVQSRISNKLTPGVYA